MGALKREWDRAQERFLGGFEAARHQLIDFFNDPLAITGLSPTLDAVGDYHRRGACRDFREVDSEGLVPAETGSRSGRGPAQLKAACRQPACPDRLSSSFSLIWDQKELLMKLTIGNSGPPPGNYTAEFITIDATHHEQFGDGMRWSFRVTNGEHTGKTATRVTTTTPTVGNNCGRVLAGLLGRSVKPDEEIDIDLLVGRTYLIVVAETEGGGTRVESIIPPPEAC
ncbi:MAG: hypothetical protein QGF59_04300 [Pirellulaceae bacterium]|nr:hypothetical protein [Pirellulaceae bacterium]